MPSRDVFLCHASPDKARVITPLAESLTKRSVSCWIDEAEILGGDSVPSAINDGIRLSRYVIVIATDDFLNREWTMQEFDAARAKEDDSGKVVIIPVLDIPFERWKETFPLEADRHALNWIDGPDAIAANVAARFRRSPSKEWAHSHPTNYVGPVWIRVNAVELGVGESIELTLRWGAYLKVLTLTKESEWPNSLTHHKFETDSVVLYVSCTSRAIVTFGTGAPPDSSALTYDIDEGWTRISGAPAPLTFPPQLIDIAMPSDRAQLANMLDDSSDAASKYLEVDRQLFNEFLKLLPSTGSTMTFLRDHDMTYSIPPERLVPLRSLVESWDNAERSFLAPELTTRLSDLIKHARDYLYDLSGASWSEGNGEWLAVVPWKDRDAFDSGMGDPEQERKVRELNSAGTALYREHQEFVDTARRQLRI